MAIEINANNPLGLTVAGPGYAPFTDPNNAYQGQNGTITSGLGYTFATFPDQQTGINAGIDYIVRKIQSGAANTVAGLVNLFSPADQNAFTQVTGLGPNAGLDVTQAPLYAAGIAAGEGTLQAFGGVNAFTGGSGSGTPATAAGGAPAGGGKASSNNPLTGIFSGLESWLGNASMSLVFVILGVVLVGGALMMFANDTGADKVLAGITPGAVKGALT